MHHLHSTAQHVIYEEVLNMGTLLWDERAAFRQVVVWQC